MTETDFSSEYLEGPTAFIDMRAVAVEEKHKTGRNRDWRENVTYLKRNWDKVTRYVLIRKKKRLSRWIGGRSSRHLDLVDHKRVGEMETITTLEDRMKPRPGGGRRRVVKKEKITEKWKNKVYFPENHRMNGGTFEFSVHFGAVNAFDLTVESEVDDVTGHCEAGRISDYPGPAISEDADE